MKIIQIMITGGSEINMGNLILMQSFWGKLKDAITVIVETADVSMKEINLNIPILQYSKTSDSDKNY